MPNNVDKLYAESQRSGALQKKTPEDFANFITEVRALCELRGIVMVSICGQEGAFGEIILFDAADPLTRAFKKEAFKFEVNDATF